MRYEGIQIVGSLCPLPWIANIPPSTTADFPISRRLTHGSPPGWLTAVNRIRADRFTLLKVPIS